MLQQCYRQNFHLEPTYSIYKKEYIKVKKISEVFSSTASVRFWRVLKFPAIFTDGGTMWEKSAGNFKSLQKSFISWESTTSKFCLKKKNQKVWFKFTFILWLTLPPNMISWHILDLFYFMAQMKYFTTWLCSWEKLVIFTLEKIKVHKPYMNSKPFRVSSTSFQICMTN